MTAQRNRIGNSELAVFPLALGGNVFGWTANEAESFNVLDRYAQAGGNFVDTADSYSFWAPGNEGGESERILGKWMNSRGNRNDIVVATKVSQHPAYKGMAPATVTAGAEASLSRLQTDVIDLYYAHFDDPDTQLEDSAAAMSSLVDEGKVRYLGISNYSPARIRQWLDICRDNGLHSPVALQPQYSLMERGIEEDLMPLTEDGKLGIIPYYSLAKGFLTGKYRPGSHVDSPRAEAAGSYMNERGNRVLSALEQVAKRHGSAPASVALAWLAARPAVTAVIASARNTEQLRDLLAHVNVNLAEDDMELLDHASS